MPLYELKWLFKRAGIRSQKLVPKLPPTLPDLIPGVKVTQSNAKHQTTVKMPQSKALDVVICTDTQRVLHLYGGADPPCFKLRDGDVSTPVAFRGEQAPTKSTAAVSSLPPAFAASASACRVIFSTRGA